MLPSPQAHEESRPAVPHRLRARSRRTTRPAPALDSDHVAVDERRTAVRRDGAGSGDRSELLGVVPAERTCRRFGYTGSTPVGRRTIEIPTGRTFRALKAVVWCRGYQTASINVPSLESSSFQATLTLTPQSTLRLTGRIQAAAGGDVTGRELQVGYDAPWQCFGSSDCFFTLIPVASARITAGGAFVVDVPDVLADPFVRVSAYRGRFSLSVSGPDPAIAPTRLTPSLDVASSYPEPFVLSVK